MPLVTLKKNPSFERPAKWAWAQIMVESLVQLFLRVGLLRST